MTFNYKNINYTANKWSITRLTTTPSPTIGGCVNFKYLFRISTRFVQIKKISHINRYG